MIDFSTLKSLTIPEGNVIKIEVDGVTQWERIKYRYVSLGDSIAAGQAIDYDWSSKYGYNSQYGVNQNTSTEIVAESYTDLIRKYLDGAFGDGQVSSRSYAVSGYRVFELIAQLSDAEVAKSIKNADLVTICIGANDVLSPAISNLDRYLKDGAPALSEISTQINANLMVLDTDSNASSYRSLFNKLTEINPNAVYVFTTIYNPYKYLWLEDGHYGFFKPLINAIPTIELFGLDIDSFIKDSLLGTPTVQKLFDRANAISDFTEGHVNNLNNVLKSKISAYNNSKFIVADIKQLYDSFPDRPVSATKHYNDLVNVEYTRDYDTGQMDWGRLWVGSNAAAFWLDLATEYTSLSGIDIDGLAEDLVAQVVEKVIVPDLDPHPETYGQYCIERSIGDKLKWQEVNYYAIGFNANGGSGAMNVSTYAALDGMPAYATIPSPTFTPSSGYKFTGWNTKADGSGTSYAVGQVIALSSDINLYAQWVEVARITLKGNGGSYATATIEGQSYSQSQSEALEVPIGTVITLKVRGKGKLEEDCCISINKDGVWSYPVDGAEGSCTYTVVRDATITFGYEYEQGFASYGGDQYCGEIIVTEL